MTIFAPTLDFTQILEDIGQDITLRVTTRTKDTNGNVTSVATSDTTVNAVVQEVSEKEKLMMTMGILDVGDLYFFVSPSTTVSTYDVIFWNATKYNIRKIFLPPRISGTLLFKKLIAVRDSSDSS